MTDFTVRSDSIDVEQIMQQIRARIREKRGVDYTEQQLRELAAVKLEKFLDPRGVRSDLLQRFKERQPAYEPPQLPLYGFEDTTIYETHRAALRWIRRVLNPILKLFFNPGPIIEALHAQARINHLNLQREEARERRRLEMEALYFEVIHNMVLEITRLGIEVKNLKMRVESLSSRVEFNERRARALESVVVYKPSAEEGAEGAAAAGPPPAPGEAPAGAQAETAAAGPSPAEGPGQRSRRRRRRRGRRAGPPASVVMGAAAAAPSNGERPEPVDQAGAPGSPPAEPPSSFGTPALQPPGESRPDRPSEPRAEGAAGRPSEPAGGVGPSGES